MMSRKLVEREDPPSAGPAIVDPVTGNSAVMRSRKLEDHRMAKALKVRRLGNSLGIILNRDVLEA